MRYLIWDFDGTLGYRDGMWTGALLELLQQHSPGHAATRDDFKPFLRDRFPWHTPDQIQGPDTPAAMWWDALDPVFTRAFQGAAGLTADDAAALARRVRQAYPDLARWHLFDDANAALASLSAAGWRHLLLSNHVPELNQIVDHLGIAPCFDHVFNSARTGICKPNARAFAGVLDVIPRDASAWMIGDNYLADVCGAERAGIPAILVRAANPLARRACPDLTGIAVLVG